MGMVMYLRRASPAEIHRLRLNPHELEEFLFPDLPEGLPETLLVDFDKAWHALHFTLTGQSYGPLRSLGIIAGEDAEKIASDDLGGPGFWIVEPEAMAEFATALEGLSDEAIVERCDPAAMIAADIYLAEVFTDENDLAIDYLMQGVPALRRFASSCKNEGDGAIRCLA